MNRITNAVVVPMKMCQKNYHHSCWDWNWFPREYYDEGEQEDWLLKQMVDGEYPNEEKRMRLLPSRITIEVCCTVTLIYCTFFGRGFNFDRMSSIFCLVFRSSARRFSSNCRSGSTVMVSCVLYIDAALDIQAKLNKKNSFERRNLTSTNLTEVRVFHHLDQWLERN